jgi:hypothetical protein
MVEDLLAKGWLYRQINITAAVCRAALNEVIAIIQSLSVANVGVSVIGWHSVACISIRFLSSDICLRNDIAHC